MEGRRRLTIDPTDEVPNPKRHRVRRVDNYITTEREIEIKSEDDDDGILLSNNGSTITEDCRLVGSVTVKDEPVDETDEKPVTLEVPDDSDDVDPLRPLKENAEVKEEPSKEKVKTENWDDVEMTPQGREDTREPRDDSTSTNTRQNEQSKTAPESGNASKIRTRLPLNCGHQNIPSAHQKAELELAPGPNILENSSDEYPVQDRSESHPGTVTEEGKPQPTSEPITHANRSKNDMSKDSDSNVIVQLLAQIHFPRKYRTKEEEDNIILTGRPTPMMRIRHSRDFDPGFWVTARDYQRIPWLTGLGSLKKYYCWPCLLFTREIWNVSGGLTQIQFWEAISLHSSNLLHQVACKNLKLRESEIKDKRNNGSNDRGILKTNREFLALLIQILCFKKTKLNDTDSNFHGYGELMKVAISYKPDLLQYVGKPLSTGGLDDFVSRHAFKLLPSIEAKIAVMISEEFCRSQFVSVIYEDTDSIVHGSSLVAVIARFLNDDGDICERFMKFVTIGGSRNAKDILNTHLAVTGELGIKTKLVGFTFSGTVVAPTSMEEFISSVKKHSPRARFFHHPDHNLKEVWLQSLSHIEECQHFLQVVSDLVKFLAISHTVPKLVAYIRLNKAKGCQRLNTRSFTIDIISTIRQYYPHFIKFLINLSHESWNDEFATQAANFTKFLRKPFSRYLIVVVAKVLDAMEDLSHVMETAYDSVMWMPEAYKVIDNLALFHMKGVLNLHSSAIGIEELIETANLFPETFTAIIETAKSCVLLRARDSHKFYIDSKYKEVADILRAPELWHRYGMQFTTSKELNNHMDYIEVFNKMFNKKTIPEMVNAVAKVESSQPNMHYLKAPKFQVWRSFIRFCAMGIAPKKSTPAAPSATVRLKFYLKNQQEFNPTEAMMFLEKVVVRSQAKNTKFIEDVISHYANKNAEYNFLQDSPTACELEIDRL